MPRSLTTFTHILLLLLALTACSRDPQLSPLPADAVILAFGDSITYGTGAARDQSYPAVLAQLSGREVVNAGIPGDVTAEGLARLEDALEAHRPHMLILCLGGNDMLRKVGHEVAARNLDDMIAMSRARGVPVLLLGVPRPALFGLESAPFYYELAERRQVVLEADIIPKVLSERDLKSDPIHPNAAGYRRIAEAVHRKLRDAGAL
jgi:lysophospholipase L1-like esterase